MGALTRLRAIGAAIAAVLAAVGGRGARVKLAPGDPAPDFALTGSDGRTYRLADAIGREAVVLSWFPKAFTPGCAAECRSLGATADALARFRVRCLAASVDSPETNARFARSLGVQVPILADPGKAVARAYGVLGPLGMASRWTFYIGMDGRILEIDRAVRASSHGRDVAVRLEALGIPRTEASGPVPAQAVHPGR